MKFKNNGKNIEFQYNGETYKVPEGDFNIPNESISRHLQYLIPKWNLDIEIISEIENVDPRKAIQSIKEKIIKDVESKTTKPTAKTTGQASNTK